MDNVDERRLRLPAPLAVMLRAVASGYAPNRTDRIVENAEMAIQRKIGCGISTDAFGSQWPDVPPRILAELWQWMGESLAYATESWAARLHMELRSARSIERRFIHLWELAPGIRPDCIGVYLRSLIDVCFARVRVACEKEPGPFTRTDEMTALVEFFTAAAEAARKTKPR